MPRENILLVSSYGNAQNKNSTNSAFGVTLNNPTRIPLMAKNVSIYCSKANIVNFFYNISSTLGNNIIYFTDDVLLPQKYTITFPDGAYDFSNVNQVLKTYFISNGFDPLALKFYSQDYTQKVSVAIKPNFGIKIPSGMSTILGYAANSTYFNSTLNVVYQDASSAANFNSIISLNLTCNIAQSNFYNGENSNLLATIPINASVGRLINYDPQIPTRIDSPHLAGTTFNYVYVQLLDQLNRPVTIAEQWNVMLTIEWDD